MVNTISIGEQPINAVEPQASLWWKEIQQVKDDTRSSLWHLWKSLTLSTMILVGPSVFWQQTTQKVEASKSQQMTAMKWWNDTVILANNGTTTKTETNPFDEEWDDKKLEDAKKKAQEAKLKAQTAEEKVKTATQTAEEKVKTATQAAEEKVKTAEQNAKTAEQVAKSLKTPN